MVLVLLLGVTRDWNLSPLVALSKVMAICMCIQLFQWGLPQGLHVYSLQSVVVVASSLRSLKGLLCFGPFIDHQWWIWSRFLHCFEKWSAGICLQKNLPKHGSHVYLHINSPLCSGTFATCTLYVLTCSLTHFESLRPTYTGGSIDLLCLRIIIPSVTQIMFKFFGPFQICVTVRTYSP